MIFKIFNGQFWYSLQKTLINAFPSRSTYFHVLPIRLHIIANLKDVLILFISVVEFTFYSSQKQPSRGILRKKCSENMQQIYRRTPMPKYDFNKVAKHIRHGCSPLNLLHIFRTPLEGCFCQVKSLKSYKKVIRCRKQKYHNRRILLEDIYFSSK